MSAYFPLPLFADICLAAILSLSVATDNVHTPFALSPFSITVGILLEPSMSVGGRSEAPQYPSTRDTRGSC